MQKNLKNSQSRGLHRRSIAIERLEKGLIHHAIYKKDSVFVPIQSVKAVWFCPFACKAEMACNEDFVNIAFIEI